MPFKLPEWMPGSFQRLELKGASKKKTPNMVHFGKGAFLVLQIDNLKKKKKSQITQIN